MLLSLLPPELHFSISLCPAFRNCSEQEQHIPLCLSKAVTDKLEKQGAKK